MLLNNSYTFREFLADFGSIASIISVVLTFLVYLGLRNIKNNYIFRIKSPQLLRFLQTKTTELNKLAEDFPSSGKQISDELVKVDVKLSSMQRRTTKSAKEAVIDLRNRIKEFELSPEDEYKYNQTYRQMLRVIEEIKEMQKDLDLE